MDTPTSKELINSTHQILATEGHPIDDTTIGDRLRNEVLPAMASTRDIQTPFYNYEPGNGKSGGKVVILRKLRNIIVNVMEHTVMRQQKYNELTFQAIQQLKDEIDELKRAAKN